MAKVAIPQLTMLLNVSIILLNFQIPFLALPRASFLMSTLLSSTGETPNISEVSAQIPPLPPGGLLQPPAGTVPLPSVPVPLCPCGAHSSSTVWACSLTVLLLPIYWQVSSHHLQPIHSKRTGTTSFSSEPIIVPSSVNA